MTPQGRTGTRPHLRTRLRRGRGRSRPPVPDRGPPERPALARPVRPRSRWPRSEKGRLLNPLARSLPRGIGARGPEPATAAASASGRGWRAARAWEEARAAAGRVHPGAASGKPGTTRRPPRSRGHRPAPRRGRALSTSRTASRPPASRVPASDALRGNAEDGPRERPLPRDVPIPSDERDDAGAAVPLAARHGRDLALPADAPGRTPRAVRCSSRHRTGHRAEPGEGRQAAVVPCSEKAPRRRWAFEGAAWVG